MQRLQEHIPLKKTESIHFDSGAGWKVYDGILRQRLRKQPRSKKRNLGACRIRVRQKCSDANDYSGWCRCEKVFGQNTFYGQRHGDFGGVVKRTTVERENQECKDLQQGTTCRRNRCDTAT